MTKPANPKLLEKLEELKLKYLTAEEALLDGLTKEERLEVGHPIKTILTLNSFMANGKKYVIRKNLTMSRFQEFEKLQVQVGYGVQFSELFDTLKKVFQYLNDNEPASASALLYNTMNGIKDKLEGRKNPVYLLCALYICREDEDVTKFDEQLNIEKIADWEIEGIDADNFFGLAFNLVNNFTPLLETALENILSPRRKAKAKAAQKSNT